MCARTRLRGHGPRACDELHAPGSQLAGGHHACLSEGRDRGGLHKAGPGQMCRVSATPLEVAYAEAVAASHAARQSDLQRIAQDRQAMMAWAALPPAEERIDIEQLPAPGPAVAGEWDAIDNFSVLDCGQRQLLCSP